MNTGDGHDGSRSRTRQDGRTRAHVRGPEGATTGSDGVAQILLTAKEVAEEYRLHLSTVYAWAKQGKIPCKLLNGQYRFERQNLDVWYAACPSAAQPPTHVPALPKAHHTDVDALIASVKREVYTAAHGETRPKSGLIRKEDEDGAV